MILPSPRPLRRHRTWGQRLLLAVLLGSVMTLLLGGTAMSYVVWRLQQIDRLNVSSALVQAVDPADQRADQLEVRPISGDQTTAGPRSNRPAENYLIVGSDNGALLDADEPASAGRSTLDGNFLADTIMLVRVRPADGSAYLLSIPRDLTLEIWGTGRTGKVNGAFNHPDPVERATRLIQTLKEGLDIGIQHYIEIDLAGFTKIVDTIGGVRVCFERPARDTKSGLRIEQAGLQRLDGSMALAYVRSRNMQELTGSGRWVTVDVRADLDRIVRQQAFLKAAVDQSLDGIVADPVRLNRVLTVVSESVSVSNTLNVVADGLDLAHLLRSFGSENLITESLAVSGGGTPSDPLVMTAGSEVQLDILRGIDPEHIVPKRVAVTVSGPAAADVVADLLLVGFRAGSRDSDGDGDGAGPPVSGGGPVTVRYGSGGERAAELVAAFLDASVRYEGDPTFAANTVEVSYEGARPAVIDEVHEVDQAPDVMPIGTGDGTGDDAPAGTTTSTTVAPASECGEA